jgi:hypothetical protein
MKNYSKRQRTIYSYKQTDKGKYNSSENSSNLQKANYIEKMTLQRLELEIKFLQRYQPDNKVLIRKCQTLIDSKNRPQ